MAYYGSDEIRVLASLTPESKDSVPLPGTVRGIWYSLNLGGTVQVPWYRILAAILRLESSGCLVRCRSTVERQCHWIDVSSWKVTSYLDALQAIGERQHEIGRSFHESR